MTAHFKLFVFDWDGTLMDSERKIVSCLRNTVNDLGLQPKDDNTLKNIIGLGLHESVLTLYPDMSLEGRHQFIDRYRYHFLTANETCSELFPGTKSTLKTLNESGHYMAIATGKGRRGLNAVLNETGLNSLFHSSRCADETCSKPHPQMLLEIMEELDVTPEQTLMIGDTEYDMEMANNARVTPLAVSYGVHERERLLRHNPVACLTKIEDLLTWLRDQMSVA